ncbi:MAG: PDZ domain-containing protein [Ferruginibacter sp.]
MKKIFYLLVTVGIFSATAYKATAQDDEIKNGKDQEIVIRKKGEKNTRVTVDINNDDILINGKPLSEFNDSNITVMKRNRIIRHGNDMFVMPRGGNSFSYDGDEGESRPFLGVTTEKSDDGVKITDVAKASAAEKAGLKEGDIITKIGSKRIEDPEGLLDAIKSYKPKNEVKIYYQRNGKSNDTKAILGERRQTKIRSFSFNGDNMPRINPEMMKDFKFEMPAMPKQPFHNFWMPSNKKLGVKIEDAENDNGAKITNVEGGSVAEKAGLKKDDVITEVDGEKVKNIEDVREHVLENEKGNYSIKAKRGSTEMSFEIKIPKQINSADL